MKSPRLNIKKQLIGFSLLAVPGGFLFYVGFSAVFCAFTSSPKLGKILALLIVVAWFTHRWLNIFLKYINRNTKEYAIFKVSEIINFQKLDFEKAKEINDSEGWGYDNHNEIKLSQVDLKESCNHAQNKEKYNNKLQSLIRLSFAIISFIIAPYGFAGGTLVMKGGAPYPPFWSGLVFLLLGFYFLYSYKVNK